MGDRSLALTGNSAEPFPCYHNLLVAVEYHAGRWSDAAVAAAAAIANAEALSATEWADVLDRLDEAIRACVPEYVPSVTRVRARHLRN